MHELGLNLWFLLKQECALYKFHSFHMEGVRGREGGSVILQANLGFDTKCAHGFPLYLMLNKIVFHFIIVWSLL